LFHNNVLLLSGMVSSVEKVRYSCLTDVIKTNCFCSLGKKIPTTGNLDHPWPMLSSVSRFTALYLCVTVSHIPVVILYTFKSTFIRRLLFIRCFSRSYCTQ